jgi:hypothetical protein
MNSKPLSTSGPNSIVNEKSLDFSKFRPQKQQIVEMPISADNSERFGEQISFENNQKSSPL